MIEMYKIVKIYEEIINKTINTNSETINRIDKLMNRIRDHINELDPMLHQKKGDLMLAIRLVECFRILEWVKVCLYCGSYHSVYRELRYLIDSLAQAYFIDKNLFSADLKAKFEVFKIFDQDKRFHFIGTELIDKLKGMPTQDKLRNLFRELSDYIHSSYKQSLDFMEKASEKDPWDRMKINIYNEDLLNNCVTKCEEIIDCFLKINKDFEKYYLKKLNDTI